MPVLIITFSLIFLTDAACASTRGYEPGDPQGGLLVLLAIIVLITLFGCAYLLYDRAMQSRVNRLRERNDVEGLARALRSSWTGVKAARALGDTGDDRAVEPLIGALGDKREDVRKAAAGSLGKLGDPRATEPLSRTLNDSYASVRDQASRALQCIKRKGMRNT